jgi:hypothetical protein
MTTAHPTGLRFTLSMALYSALTRVLSPFVKIKALKRGRKEKPPEPRWQSAGYKKKSVCDRCGFRSRYASQLLVYHIDSNQHNIKGANLKTICLNCVEEVKRMDVPWARGDLQADN